MEFRWFGSLTSYKLFFFSKDSKEVKKDLCYVFMKGREQSRPLIKMISCDLVYFEKCHELIRISCREISFTNSSSSELYHVIVYDTFELFVLKS